MAILPQETPRAIDAFTVSRLEDIGFTAFLEIMALSLISALFVTWLYRHSFRNRATGSDVHKVFLLLSISITAIFIVIQFSLPLSLGLLGSLSIVRFRTPVKEPEEVGFVLLVVAAALCCATFNLRFLGVLLLGATAAVMVKDLRRTKDLLQGGRSGMLVVTLPPGDASGIVGALLARLHEVLPKGSVDSVDSDDARTVVSYNFSRMTQEMLGSLQGELRQVSENARFNLFFHRTAA